MPEDIIAEHKPTESSAAAPVEKVNPFAAFSQTQIETVTKEPVVSTEPPAAAVVVEKKPGEEGYVEPAKAELKEGDVGYVKPAEGAKPDAAPILEPAPFKFSDQQELGKDVSFQTVGTKYGFEVKENTPTAFDEGFKNHIKAIETKASETSFLSQLEKEPAAVQEAYLLAKNNFSLDEIAKPTQQIDNLLGLSNIDLAKAELDTNKNLSAAIKEAELERLTTSGELDGYANDIRVGLNERKTEIAAWRTNNLQQLMEKEKTRQVAESTQRLTSVEKAIMEVTEFMGIPVTAETQKGFVQRLKLGNYNDVLNDPKAIATAIMHKEMSQYALNELKQKAIAPIIEKQIKDQHNIPAHQNIGSVVEQPKPNGPFGAFM